MRRVVIALVLVSIVALALLPWVAQAIRPQPLLPEELRLARQHYEATVETAQDGTIEAIRQATSVPEIRIIGTVPGSTPIVPTAAVATTTVQTIAIVIKSTLPAGDSAAPVTTLPPRLTPTTEVTPTISAETSSEPLESGSGGPPTPANMVDVEDILTEAQMVEQVRRDAGDDMLLDLSLHITGDGVSAGSTVTVFPGIEQQIEAGGTFAVENDSLIFRAEFVQLNGVDVTAQYRDSLESQITTSLYRLLPGRFVQSFELGSGEVRVTSKMRP